MIEQFLAAYMKQSLRGAPRIVTAAGHSFSDVASQCVHIVNLASVRALERIVGRPVDPLRFRANIYVDGIPAWDEFNWLERHLAFGAEEAAAEVQVWARTQRCDATNVDPATAARDMAIPSALQRAFGHMDFGVYAAVTKPGTLADDTALLLRPR